LPGLDIGGRIITSEQALQLDWIPNKVLVLGGSVIGVEFASVWRSFGSEVTIIEGLPHLVPAEDESISKQFERAYRKRGMNFHTGVRLQSATQDDTSVTVTLEDGTTETADLLSTRPYSTLFSALIKRSRSVSRSITSMVWPV